MRKVVILGNGRIGKAISFYLRKYKLPFSVSFFSKESDISLAYLLIGALPGEIGEESLELALKYNKDLIDISDLEPEFYLKKEKDIKKKGILVLANCGFCPGLVNFIIGHEVVRREEINSVEVKAGTLAPKKFFFPFLWSFEDLILEHEIPSWQLISGKKEQFPPFANYEQERFFGIEAESYFAQSGFENFVFGSGMNNFTFKVVRPLGFLYFFKYLKNYNFFQKGNLPLAKKILEGRAEDNLTFATVKMTGKKRRNFWQMESFSRKREIFNSMQKITALFPVLVLKSLEKKKLGEKGLFFPEDLAKYDDLFVEVIREFEGEISIKRS